jgi:predicted lipoprotein with Yx(FWY)xxD motif
MKDNSTTTGGHSMKRLLIAVAAVAAALVLAACGGGGADSSGSPAPAGDSSATVSVEEIDDSGPVLIDSAGKALYTSDEEAADPGLVCTEACASFWEPLTVDQGAPTGDVPGALGVAERPDGTRQVTLDGKRLYSFVQDEPGEVTGDGFSDAFDGQQFTWHVVTAGGTSDADQGGASDTPFDY